VLQRQLGTTSRARDPELTRYAAGVLHLERRLARRDDLLATLRTGIEHAGGLAEAHGPASSGVIEALAAVYVDTIARLGPRIMVGGEPHILRDPRNAGRIRALLLTGIRSAVLWRQLGGSRLRLFLERRRYAEAARTLAGDCPA
jgi:high frequency lysogenization protein